MFLESQICILEGSCDTEDWSKDAENKVAITGLNKTLKYITIKKDV